MGSADLMNRNLDRRVEVLLKIENSNHQSRLRELLDLALSDEIASWRLDSAGTWHYQDKNPRGEKTLDYQEELIKHYQLRGGQ